MSNPVRVFIHFDYLDRPWGGSNSFLKTLAAYLRGRPEVALCRSFRDDFDVLLIAGWSTGVKSISRRAIRNIRKYGYPSGWQFLLSGRRHRRRKIIHRLDGLRSFYGTRDPESERLVAQLNQYSDRSVIQSAFCGQLFERVGIALSPAEIISNGVDQTVFHFKDKRWWNPQRPLVVGAVSWSPNPRKGHECIAAFSQLPSLSVRFIGNWAPNVASHAVQRLAPVPFQELAEFYRSCDVLLFPSENEACPNVVLEAISCGLPVLYHPSGGTPEIAGPFGMSLGDQTPEEAIDAMRQAYPKLVDHIQQRSHELSIEKAGEKYVRLFQQVWDDR